MTSSRRASIQPVFREGNRAPAKKKKYAGGDLVPRKPENGRAGAPSDAIATWMSTRDELVARMSRDGTWQPAFAPLLHEFSEALRMAAKLREVAEGELFVKSARSGRSYAHPGIALADVEVRRAALLLSRVDSMVKSRPAEDEPEDVPENPFTELEALELGEGIRRAKRSRLKSQEKR